MKYRIIAAMLCGLLLISGCQKQDAVKKKKEESAGTGYGVSQKSALLMQDLYFLRPGTTRQEVEAALGSPQSFLIADANKDTYRLTTGETLVLTYNEKEKITAAQFSDLSGKRQDFFAYLNELGIITNYHPSETEPEEETQPEQEPETSVDVPVVDQPMADPSKAGYFATKRYDYALADQIIALGAERETVVSALGKPNSYSSVTFAKDTYIVDVYVMEDGSSLHLDYGYNRLKLRAVRQIKGTESVDYLGSWGEEKKPSGYIRGVRKQVFMNLKQNATPAEIYRRYGAPDWLEGNADRYRDAYQMRDGAVFYLDFGPNHNALTAATMQKADSTIVVYTLR